MDAIPCYAQGLEALATHQHVSMPNIPQEADVQYDENAYLLSVDDVIKIIVNGEDDLSGRYKIASSGKISFPLTGEISVQGLSSQQVEQLLIRALSDGYLVNPRVFVEVISKRVFYILGERFAILVVIILKKVRRLSML